MSFPVLRVVGGLLLIVAGVFAYYGVSFGLAAALIFVIGGVIVITISVSGHRPSPMDVGIFVLGLLALSGVTLGYGPANQTSQVMHYSATPAQIPENSIFLNVSASTGSVDVGFTNNASVGYSVTLSRSFGSFPFIPAGAATVTNSTRGGVFLLNVTSGSWAVSVLLNSHYSTGIQVFAGTGSVSLDTGGNEDLTNVALSTSTGSVDATVDSTSIRGLSLTTNTGSVSLTSHHLGSGGRSVPVSLSTNTGSVSMSASLGAGAATVSASSDLGSVSHQLRGFTVTQSSATSVAASFGDISSARSSFVITARTNLGSVDVTLDISPS